MTPDPEPEVKTWHAEIGIFNNTSRTLYGVISTQKSATGALDQSKFLTFSNTLFTGKIWELASTYGGACQVDIPEGSTIVPYLCYKNGDDYVRMQSSSIIITWSPTNPVSNGWADGFNTDNYGSITAVDD